MCFSSQEHSVYFSALPSVQGVHRLPRFYQLRKMFRWRVHTPTPCHFVQGFLTLALGTMDGRKKEEMTKGSNPLPTPHPACKPKAWLNKTGGLAQSWAPPVPPQPTPASWELCQQKACCVCVCVGRRVAVRPLCLSALLPLSPPDTFRCTLSHVATDTVRVKSCTHSSVHGEEIRKN